MGALDEIVEKYRKTVKGGKMSVADRESMLKEIDSLDPLADASVDRLVSTLLELPTQVTRDYLHSNFPRWNAAMRDAWLQAMRDNQKITSSKAFLLSRFVHAATDLMSLDADGEGYAAQLLLFAAPHAKGQDAYAKAASTLKSALGQEATFCRLAMLPFPHEDPRLEVLDGWLRATAQGFGGKKAAGACVGFMEAHRLAATATSPDEMAAPIVASDEPSAKLLQPSKIKEAPGPEPSQELHVPVQSVKPGSGLGNRKDTPAVSEEMTTKRVSAIDSIGSRPAKSIDRPVDKAPNAVGLAERLLAAVRVLETERRSLARQSEELGCCLREESAAYRQECERWTDEKSSLEAQLRNALTQSELARAEAEKLRIKCDEIDASMRELASVRGHQRTQELGGFKRDVARRLRIDYKDYYACKGDPASVEQYKTLMLILDSAFHTLKQLGIPLDEILEV